MNKPRSIVLIPTLYALVIIIANIISIVLYDQLDIADPTMKLIRLGSITNLIFYGSLFVLYIVLYLPSWKQTILQFKRKFPVMAAMIFIGAVSMFAAMIILGLAYTALGIIDEPENQQILDMQLNGPLFDRVSLIVFAVLLAPVVEEMMFRLAGFRLLRRFPNIPTWVVILITSLLFGMIHVLGDNIVQIIYYAGLGVVLGVIYHKSKNILVPITVHMLFNAFVTLTMFIGI